MSRKILLAALLSLCGGVNAPAQLPAAAAGTGLGGLAVYSDPGFQEFIETSYGYLSPRHSPRPSGRLRDAVAAPRKAAAAGAREEAYVFVSILPATRDHAGLLRQLAASSGFVLSGERTIYIKGAKETRLVGRARASGLAAIRANSGVAGVNIEKEAPAVRRSVP